MATAKKTPAAAATKPGTAVAVKKASNVVNIQELLKKQAEEMAGRTQGPGGNSIRISQDKNFLLPDGSKTPGPLQLVIVDFISRNEFYAGQYDKDNIVPPDCFAIGVDPKGLVPSNSSPAKQSDEGCNACPMNVFGSAGNGKACKNTRMMAVLPPDADAETELWTLKVSPTGLKSFDGYVNNVARTFGAPPVAVVTEVSFDPNSDWPSLRFADPQPNENVGTHFARQAEAKELLEREPDLTQRAAAPAKPARPQARGRVAAGARR